MNSALPPRKAGAYAPVFTGKAIHLHTWTHFFIIIGIALFSCALYMAYTPLASIR